MSSEKRKSKIIQTAGALSRKRASKPELAFPDELINEIREMIESSRARVAQTINAGMTLLYWQIGHRIHQDILRENGQSMVPKLSRHFHDNW
jgi:hypothetical protein